jgi:phosphate starvation-inducible PhoH-like protein
MSRNNNKKPSRKQRREMERQGSNAQDGEENLRFNFKIANVEPLTKAQKDVYEAYEEGYNLLLHGVAGTGKTFLALYLALREVMEGGSPYKKVIIIRSVVPTRDMGFLPGSNADKTKVYETPYERIAIELFGRGDAYQVLKQKRTLEFLSTSFIRGTTYDNAIIVADEIQNMDFGELDSVITRIGENCKVMLCGDFRQTDFRREAEKSGIQKFMKIIDRMESFDVIDFTRDDIVRSGLVKEYIIAKDDIEK